MTGGIIMAGSVQQQRCISSHVIIRRMQMQNANMTADRSQPVKNGFIPRPRLARVTLIKTQKQRNHESTTQLFLLNLWTAQCSIKTKSTETRARPSATIKISYLHTGI